MVDDEERCDHERAISRRRERNGGPNVWLEIIPPHHYNFSPPSESLLSILGRLVNFLSSPFSGRLFYCPAPFTIYFFADEHRSKTTTEWP